MSTVPDAPAGARESGLSPQHRSPNDCWSCRLISGGGLIAAAAYVFAMTRKPIRAGTPMGTIGKMAQLTFAAGLAAWGVFVIVGNKEKKMRDK